MIRVNFDDVIRRDFKLVIVAYRAVSDLSFWTAGGVAVAVFD